MVKTLRLDEMKIDSVAIVAGASSAGHTMILGRKTVVE